MVVITDVSSFPSSEWKYDAFLSFRGTDTRKSFISHLYKELLHEGINTFKDDRELETGHSISQTIPKAIRESRILIIIFSENYASSTWCLDELVQILEFKKAGRQTVLPIFYGVTPSQVRKLSGNFGESFADLEERFKENVEEVQRWRAAMTEVADLKGWELQDGDESEFIHEIVKDIISKLGRFSKDITKGLVGMELRLEKMRSYLDIKQSDEVKIIGVWGMGGIGKTTIASVVYKQMYSQFEGSSFLADIREASKRHDGLVSLQNKFLSAILNRDVKVHDVHRGIDEIRKRLRHKKVLLILDDVDELVQLEYLIGKRDENWFCKGSRIIITTRNKHLLVQHGVDNTYMLEELDGHEALELFYLKAFKTECPTRDYVELSDQVLRCASGLPLALSVLGSYLFSKSIKEWKSALERLKEIPNEEILGRLKISFDGLDEIDKKIFLDIACFFNGEDENYVRKILESCGFYPENGMRELINKSLITISDRTVWMHAFLREMGQEIVRRESFMEPGQRSRIWLYKDIYHVLMNETGSEKNEGLVLDLLGKEAELINGKGFSKMNHLRLLILRNASIFHGLEYLSNELRYLEWHEFPFNSLPSAFQPSKLVELHMHHSNLKQLWEAIKPMQLLKVIDLSYSKDLIKTLDFRNIPNLEVLNLEGCTSLVEVDRSIVLLTRLVWLNLKGCEILETLPSGNWNLKSLKILNLCGCLKLSKLPEGLVSATSLEVLDAAGIGSGQMTLAKACDLHSNYLVPATRNQKPLAFAFSSPQAMMKLVMSYCAFPQVLNNLSCFWSLGKLNLCGNHVLSIPSSINQLCNLTDVDFSNCRRLESLPAIPCNIERLSIGNCTSLQALPDMAQLSKLTDLWIPNCRRLESLPTLPPNIGWLFIEDCTSLQTLPDLVQLFELTNLVIYNCSRLESLPALPSNVESINMQNCTSLQTLPEMVQLCRLASLRCTNCTSLQLLPDLPSNVQHLYMENCTALEAFPNLFEKQNLEKSFYIGFPNCSTLNYCQTKISVAFAWLRSYLLWLYEIRKLTKIEESCQSEEDLEDICHQRCNSPEIGVPDFYIYLPGSVIPDWFSYQGDSSPLRIQLPPFETWWNIAGFAVCAVFGGRKRLEPFCYIEVNSKSGVAWSRLYQVPIPGASKVVSDHLSLFFAASDKLDPDKEWNPTELFLDFPEEEIKECGIRVVYEKDIQELVQ